MKPLSFSVISTGYNSGIAIRRLLVAVALGMGSVHPVDAEMEPVSRADVSAIAESAAAASADALFTPDGRFVLFASAAENLAALNDANPPVLSPLSGKANAFLRDRLSGANTLVSLNANASGGGNAASHPKALSTDGRFALFASAASDLIPGDTNNAADLFMRDLVLETTLLVSAGADGSWPNGESSDASMTPDGRFVAFTSRASNLVANDTNGIPDVFVRDLQLGLTLLASPGSITTTSVVRNAGGPASLAPRITSDGRYVAFFSTAVGLVPGVETPGEIYVRDLVSEVTLHASAGAHAALGEPLVAYNHRISDDGRFVVYQAHRSNSPSAATLFRYDRELGNTEVVATNAPVLLFGFKSAFNLDISPDGRFIAYVAATNNGVETGSAVFLWDGNTASTSLASVASDGGMPVAGICDQPRVTSDGRYVSFLSTATNLVSDPQSGAVHLYVRDTATETTDLVDVRIDETESLECAENYGVTPDGQFVLFGSDDSGLVAGDHNGNLDVLLRDRLAESTELISVRAPALPSETPNGPSGTTTLYGSTSPMPGPPPNFSVSHDGGVVVFATLADNTVAGDTNRHFDAVARDLLNQTNLLISSTATGSPADMGSIDPVISGDVRYAAFSSRARNLVPGVTNGVQNIFRRDLQTGAIELVTVRPSGPGGGNGDSHSPQISFGGRHVLFFTFADNLGGPSYNLRWRDMEAGFTRPISTTFPAGAGMSDDGRYVAFSTSSSGFQVWDMEIPGSIYQNSTGPGSSAFRLSPDGRRIVFANAGMQVRDLVAVTNGVINAQVGFDPRFSSNSRFLVYLLVVGAIPNQFFNVFFFDFDTGEGGRITRAFDGGNPNHHSDSAVITPNGRFVAFRSRASNIVPNDTNGMPDIFLYDRQTDTTTLLTVSAFTGAPANNRSLSPVFSGDGQTLFFKSWASDLVQDDYNQAADLFSFKFASPSGETQVFSGQIVFAPTSGQSPTLTWPVEPGRSYRVEYKNELSDPEWLPLNGITTIVGEQGYATDLAPHPTQRFYRIQVE